MYLFDVLLLRLFAKATC